MAISGFVSTAGAYSKGFVSELLQTAKRDINWKDNFGSIHDNKIRTVRPSNLKAIKPHLKVMITFPRMYESRLDIVRSELINTFKGGWNKENRHVGLWIDLTDNPNDPDKIQLMIHAPTKDETVLKWLREGILANRHWIDIWIDYESPYTQTAKNLANASRTVLGKRGGVTSRLDNLTNRLSSGSVFMSDDLDFNFFEPPHLFSGEIVSATRNIGIGGDRIILTAWGPSFALKRVRAYKPKDVWGLVRSNLEKTNIVDTLTKIWKSVVPLRAKIVKDAGTQSLEDHFIAREDAPFKVGEYPAFFCGQFYYQIFDFEKPPIFNLTGLPFDDDKSVSFFSKYKPKPIKSNLRLNNLWDYIYAFTRFEVTRIEGVGCKFGGSSINESALMAGSTAKKPIHLVNAGRTGRPSTFVGGIRPIFFPLLEMKDLVNRVSREEQNIPIPDGIIGENVLDFWLTLDRDNIFNEIPFSLSAGDIINKRHLKTHRFPFLDKDTVEAIESVEEGNPDIELLRSLRRILYNTTMQNMGVMRGGSRSKEIGMMQEDFLLFGPNTYPATLVFTRDNIADNQEEAINMITDFAIGGLTGEAMIVGFNHVIPRNIIFMRDGRKRSDNILLGANAIKAAEAALFSKFGTRSSIIDNYGWKLSTVPYMGIASKTGDESNIFYIWKTRHYFGSNTGYTTKVYFSNQRRDPTINFSKEVSSVMKQAIGRKIGASMDTLG